MVAWGNDWNGQCTLPASVTNVTALAAGDSHTLVLLGNPNAAPVLLRPRRQAGQFSLWVQTVAGRTYDLEYVTSLGTDTWATAARLRGNGARQMLLDSAATGPQRFYRVRQW